MKGLLLLSAIVSLGLSSAVQAAPRTEIKWTDPGRIGATWSTPAPSNVSHIIYLNNCAGGCTLHPGNNDSTTNTSSIPSSNVQVSAYSGGDANWNAIVQCVKNTYAPFNVQIVTDRPPAGTDYHMAIVAGHAADVGEPQGVLGVSPFSCGYIQNSISFSFADEEPTNIDDICWTVSQETAHSWGLDHKFDDRDPMTYLTSGPMVKMFQNQAGDCGEYSARQCMCTYQGTGDTMENSYALIMATFGPSTPDTTPPTVMITSPSNGAQVQPGFPVRANLSDDTAVSKAELRIDGNLIGSALVAAPWVWNAPMTLAMGSHHVEVTGYDAAGNTAKDAVDVTYGSTCTADSQCSSGQVCSNGVCVAGPSMTGGLGSPCMTNADCDTGSCASDGTNSYCVSSCDPMNSTCPGGFGCVATGASGVCWPGADKGGKGGGCDAGGDTGLPIVLGLTFAALVFTRRRA